MIFTWPVCVGWWKLLGERFLWGYDPCSGCWRWSGVRSCPRAPEPGCCNWGPNPPAWTGSHRTHEEIWSGAGCWPELDDEGWTGLWSVHPEYKQKNHSYEIINDDLCPFITISPTTHPSINLTLIIVNLLESKWSDLSRRRSLKADGRIWLMVFLDNVRCSRLVMLAKSFLRTAGGEQVRNMY